MPCVCSLVSLHKILSTLGCIIPSTPWTRAWQEEWEREHPDYHTSNHWVVCSQEVYYSISLAAEHHPGSTVHPCEREYNRYIPKTNICANSGVHIEWIHSPIDSSGLITQHTFLVQKWTISALNSTHCTLCHLESWGLWFIKHTLHWRYHQWLFECRQYRSIIQKAVLDTFSLSVCEEDSSSVLEGVNI